MIDDPEAYRQVLRDVFQEMSRACDKATGTAAIAGMNGWMLVEEEGQLVRLLLFYSSEHLSRFRAGYVEPPVCEVCAGVSGGVCAFRVLWHRVISLVMPATLGIFSVLRRTAEVARERGLTPKGRLVETG